MLNPPLRAVPGMPPFRAAVLSDDELDDIYAYLQSVPAPKAVSDIPLLNGARSN